MMALVWEQLPKSKSFLLWTISVFSDTNGDRIARLDRGCMCASFLISHSTFVCIGVWTKTDAESRWLTRSLCIDPVGRCRRQTWKCSWSQPNWYINHSGVQVNWTASSQIRLLITTTDINTSVCGISLFLFYLVQGFSQSRALEWWG